MPAYTQAEIDALRTLLAPCPGVIGGSHTRYSSRSKTHGQEPRRCYQCGKVLPLASETWETRCRRLLAYLDSAGREDGDEQR